MRRRPAAVLSGLALLLPSVAVAAPSAGERATARLGPIVVTTKSVKTSGGTRPFHLIRFPPGRGVRLEAVWLGGGPGRSGTVGGYVRANARRGAVGGVNGDFFILARKVPSGNLFIHRARNWLGNTERGAALFAADGSVDIRPGNVRSGDLLAAGVREATSGKPVYVDGGRIGHLGTLTSVQLTPSYHRSAVGRFANGDSGLVAVGGAGLGARAFAQGLIRMGFVEALGMDLDSSTNLNWRGASLNRPSFQRAVPTGTIVFWRPPA